MAADDDRPDDDKPAGDKPDDDGADLKARWARYSDEARQSGQHLAVADSEKVHRALPHVDVTTDPAPAPPSQADRPPPASDSAVSELQDLVPRRRLRLHLPSTNDFVIIYGAGLLSTALALYLEWQLGLMQLYLRFLPAGAFLLGAIAGAGYGVSAKLLRSRITYGLWLPIGVLQLLAYVTLQYLEYSHFLAMVALDPVLSDVSFGQYFRVVTTSMGFEIDGSTVVDELGSWGYLFRLAEILAYTVGGLVAPVFIRDWRREPDPWL